MTLAVTPIALLAAASPVPNVTPDASRAPGGKGLQDAINVFAFYGLLAAIAGFLLGGAVWAVGGRAGNDYAAQGGKVGMAVAVGVAFLIGAASAIITFAFNAGGT
jgi:vacuolar-type H+-ATPase subunit I/STV1